MHAKPQVAETHSPWFPRWAEEIMGKSKSLVWQESLSGNFSVWGGDFSKFVKNFNHQSKEEIWGVVCNTDLLIRLTFGPSCNMTPCLFCQKHLVSLPDQQAVLCLLWGIVQFQLENSETLQWHIKTNWRIIYSCFYAWCMLCESVTVSGMENALHKDCRSKCWACVKFWGLVDFHIY